MKTHSYLVNEKGRLERVETAEARERWTAGDGPFWIAVVGPENNPKAELLKSFGIDHELISDFLDTGHAPRVLTFEQGVLFEIPIAIVGDPPELASSTLLCMDRIVVTLQMEHTADANWSDEVAVERVDVPERSAVELAASLVVVASTDLRERCSQVRGRMAALAHRLDKDAESVGIGEIVALRRDIVDLESISEERAAVLDVVASTKTPRFDMAPAAEAFRIAVGNTSATVRRVDRMDRRAGDLRARYDSHQQEKVNRRLSRLTVISAVFLPLTLVAGIYGMNFETMPELHYRFAYPAVLGGMAAIAIGMFVWFRRRGWID